MKRSIDDLAPTLDLGVDGRSPGVLRRTGRTVTAPVRGLAAVAKVLLNVVRVLVGIVLFPILLGVALVQRIVMLAADVLFAVWRLIRGLIGLVLGLVRLLYKLLDATVGNVIRIVVKLVWGVLKLVLKIITLGRFGKAGAVGVAGAAVASRASKAQKPAA